MMVFWLFQGPRGLVGSRGPPGSPGQPVSCNFHCTKQLAGHRSFCTEKTTTTKKSMASRGRNKYGLYTDCLLLAPIHYLVTF